MVVVVVVAIVVIMVVVAVVVIVVIVIVEVVVVPAVLGIVVLVVIPSCIWPSCNLRVILRVVLVVAVGVVLRVHLRVVLPLVDDMSAGVPIFLATGVTDTTGTCITAAQGSSLRRKQSRPHGIVLVIESYSRTSSSSSVCAHLALRRVAAQ